MAAFMNFLVVMALMIASTQFHGMEAQTIHTVGGSLGWTVPPAGPSDYTTWASRQTFTVGDVLLFNFTTGAHNVAEVSQAAYGPCTTANPISLVATGPARLTLNAPGTHYYICTVGTHCQIGQKLTINVAASSATPSPASSPVPTPRSAPVPSTISSPPTSSPSPSQSEANPPSQVTSGASPTGSTTLPPPSPSGVAPSYTAIVPFTLLATALAFFY